MLLIHDATTFVWVIYLWKKKRKMLWKRFLDKKNDDNIKLSRRCRRAGEKRVWIYSLKIRISFLYYIYYDYFLYFFFYSTRREIIRQNTRQRPETAIPARQLKIVSSKYSWKKNIHRAFANIIIFIFYNNILAKRTNTRDFFRLRVPYFFGFFYRI